MVAVLYPFLRYFGYGMDWKEATILGWSGLRGAVALSLSLSVKASSADIHSPITKSELLRVCYSLKKFVTSKKNLGGRGEI